MLLQILYPPCVIGSRAGGRTGAAQLRMASTGVSYAKVVGPAATEVSSVAAQKVTEVEVAVEALAENIDEMGDDDGFQEVTKKVKDRGPKKKFKNKFKGKFKDKTREGTPQDGDFVETELPDSKESSPEKGDEVTTEFIPAPPPKTNPWTKSVSAETKSTAPAKVKKEVSKETVEKVFKDVKVVEAESEPVVIKEKKKRKEVEKVIEISITTAPVPPAKQNPWKKIAEEPLRAAAEGEVEPDAVPKVKPEAESVNKKSSSLGSGDKTWPTLGEEEQIHKRKGGAGKKNSDASADSGAASSLDTAEDAKENQVG